MGKADAIRLIRIFVFTGLLLGSVVSASYYWPKIKKEKFPSVIETFEKNFGETDQGKTVLKILGAEVDEEKDEDKEEKDEEEEKEKEKEEEENKSLMENIKGKIEEAVIETSSEKVIDILENLPPEEFEKLKEEFCPQFCERE